MDIKYFLYARKSTEDEERQVMSIEAQVFESTEYAKSKGLFVAENFIESRSAKKPGRTVFGNMIEKIHKSKDPVGLLSWHPDRLARNSVDGGQIIYLIDIGKIISLKFPTFWFEPTPQGLFMLQIAFGQSKYYSDNLSQNVRRGIRQKLRRGEYPGCAPIGYINNLKTRNIEPDDIKSKIIKKAFEEFSQGRHTLESLRKRLSFWGVVSRNGTMLSKSSVKKILTNPVYTAVIARSGELYNGSFAPIVSKATFEAVQEVLDERSRPRKSKASHNFPFTGLLKCGECGASITAQFAKGNGGLYRYYRCTKKLGKCYQPYLREDLLTYQLKDELQKVALCEDLKEKMLAQISIWEKEDRRSSHAFSQNLSNKITETEEKLDKLVIFFLDGLVDKDTYLDKKNQLVKTKADLIQKKKGFGKKTDNWIEPLRELVNDAHHAEELASLKDLNAIKSFMKKIGTNRRLLDKKVLLQWERPWEFLAERDESSNWLGREDSNLRSRDQNPLPYHLATPQSS